MKKAYSVFAFLLAAVLAVSCFNPLNNEKSAVGNLHIAWGNFDRSRTFVQQPELPDFDYTVTLTGPGGTIQETFTGASSASFKVKHGDWRVTVKGRTPSGVLRVMGIIEKVTVTAKKSAAHTIVMYTATEVDTWDDLDMALRINDLETEAGEREELFLITKDMNDTDKEISIMRKVIMISEKPITVGRSAAAQGVTFPSFFNINSGGRLTLGMAGMGGTLGFDNNDKDSKSLFFVEGELVMNKDVRIANCKTANGGGVYVASGGTFSMNGGVISGNKASDAGGGVYIQINGDYQGTGGTFSGNFNGNRLQDVYRESLISFPSDELNKVYGDPEIDDYTALGGQGDGAVTYSSDNAAVATVDENSGTVTIVGAGQAVITATKARDGDYALASANYTLKVAQKYLDIFDAVHTKPYDGSTTADGVTVTLVDDILPSDTGEVLPDVVTADYTNVNAGTNTINIIDVTLQGSKAGNYAVTPQDNVPVAGITKANGSAVSKPTASGTTQNSITVSAVTLSTATGQSVQYANSANNNADPETLTWGSATTFSGLSSGTTYYVYARSVGNGNYKTGTANISNPIATTSYGISLLANSTPLAGTTHTFATATFGYTALTVPAALTVTITNTGNQPTGSLSAALSEANASSFTLSKTSIGSITAGGETTFTVVPIIGLGGGTYNAKVTVSGGTNITSQNFNVSFTVNAYGISLSPADAYTFPGVQVGYSDQPEQTVTVTNTGNQPTGPLTAALTGTDADSFTLSTTSITSIGVGGTGAFTVKPKTGLSIKTHNAKVTVSGGTNISDQAIDLSFTVSATPVYGVSLSQTGTYTFAAAAVGYGTQTARSVTVSNSGNQPTGELTVALSPTSASNNFTLSTSTLTSIPTGTGTTRNFTVQPKTGLAAGTYTATVTVAGGNSIAASFTVSFTVNTYSVSLLNGSTQLSAFSFAALTFGYGTAPAALSVNVANTGTAVTGTLSVGLAGSNPGSFTLSTTSVASIAVGGTSTGAFTIVPITGLAAGTHTATITVSGSNSITASFTVSFTVNPIVINIAAITGVTKPVTGATPVTAITETTQYTGNIAWSGSPSTFASNTAYTATITLTAKANYTLTGVTANFFTVAGTTSVTYTAGSNSVSATFPATETTISLKALGVTQPATGATPVTALDTTQYTGTVTWSPALPSTRTVKIDMYDSYGDGWDGSGALRITKNGANLATSVKVQNSASNNNPNGQRYTNTYSFSVNTSDVIEVYWVAGSNQQENSFVVYYADTPPSPAFSPSSWSGSVGSNALVYKLSLDGISDGAKLGSFTASRCYASDTAYTANISLSPKTGYTLTGVAANSFTVTGASSVSNSANSGSVTAVFPATAVYTYGISLDRTGTYTFSEAIVDYTTAPSALSVAVNNTGNQPTGALTVKLVGNASRFTLSTESISSISVGAVRYFTIRPNTGLALGTYSSTVVVWGGNGSAAIFDISFTVVRPYEYVITGSGTSFTAVRGGSDTISSNQPIQTVINAIKANATGKVCSIQFGNGTSTLDIGSGRIEFNGSGSPGWGTITLKGKLTSSSTIGNDGIIYLNNGASIYSAADLTATSTSTMITNNSTGSITINSGTVKVTTYGAIRNLSTGTVSVNGSGTVQSGGDVICNFSSGTVNVYGNGVVKTTTTSVQSGIYNPGTGAVNVYGNGQVLATSNGYGIYSPSTGKITVSGNGKVSSDSDSHYTIYVGGTSTGVRLEISGGTVENTGGGTTIYNDSAGEVIISGGKVSTADVYVPTSPGNSTVIKGNAVQNASTGTVNISGGLVRAENGYAIRRDNGTVNLSNNAIVFAYGTAVSNVINGTYAPSGNYVIVAYDGTSAFATGSSAGIFKSPTSGVTAVWDTNNGEKGIRVTRGTNTGFIDVDFGGIIK